MNNDITVLAWLKSLEPALPLSPIKNKDGSFNRMSNGDIRRLCEQASVLINGKTVKPFDLMTFPVESLVFYPKSATKRTTLF